MTKTYISRSIFLLLSFTVLCTSCCPHKFAPHPKPPPPEPFYVPEKIRVALVLGSGGVRGMAHIGVLEVLENAGIPIDLIVGCSAGSIVGALYAENPCVKDIMQPAWNMRAHTILDLDIWNSRYGLSQGLSMTRVLDKDLNSETFEELRIPLVVVASDLNSAELVPFGAGDLVKAVRASCSIPFVFVPCEYRGRVLVDGGTIDPVPVKVARDLGANIIIAVDLSELLDKTFPTNLFSVLGRSTDIAFIWQNQVATRDADVVIRPRTCEIGTFNDDMKNELYLAGRKAALEQLPKIIELIKTIPADDWNKNGKRLVQMQCYTPQIYLNFDGDNAE